MLRLHGFSASNYYNIPKLALLEKGVPFEEVLVYTGAGPDYRPDFLDASPLGKVPCLETEDGFVTESRCIVEYIERAFPTPALYPATPFAQAKLLELTQIIDLYLELPSRRLLLNLFSKKQPPERLANEVIKDVSRGANAVRELAKFDTFLLGEQFTAADIAGVIHFPVVSHVMKRVLGCDPLAEVPGLSEYVARVSQRPTVQRVRKDQVANHPAFMEHLRVNYGVGATPA